MQVEVDDTGLLAGSLVRFFKMLISSPALVICQPLHKFFVALRHLQSVSTLNMTYVTATAQKTKAKLQDGLKKGIAMKNQFYGKERNKAQKPSYKVQ